MASGVGDATGDDAPLLLRLGVAVAACGSVIPLLAWVSGLGAFHVWSLLVGLPAVLATIAFGVLVARPRWPATFDAMVAGAIGGLVGSIGYDVFRVPFVYGLGRQLLAPIDSYGVLLLGADASSPLTGFLGWSYHFTNGIGFGVAYALVARNRHPGWALLWAMVLESATIVSDFAPTYGLRTEDGFNVVPIALAYAAHVPYGLALGWATRDVRRTVGQAREVTRRPVLVAVTALVVALALWQRPLLPNDAIARGRAVAAGPSAVIEDRRFEPTWLRVAPGECATVENRDDAPATLGAHGDVLATLAPGARTEVCAEHEGRRVQRVQVGGRPFSGGWLLVDPSG